MNYIKGRRKGKGGEGKKGGKGKKGGDSYKGKGKSKGKRKQGDYTKGKGKGYNKGGQGNYYQGSSWSTSWDYQGGSPQKGQGRGKGKGGKSTTTTQCHICKKFGHIAANCWYKDTTCTTAAIGSGTTGQTQHYNLDILLTSLLH